VSTQNLQHGPVNWSYQSKRSILENAIRDLVKFAYWGETPHSLGALKSIHDDLSKLEELSK